VKIITTNRRARHEYQILEEMEAGIVLKGTEVKSLRAGKASLQDSYANIRDGELYLHNLHIASYEAGNRFNHPEKRTRKLLMHRREIDRLDGKIAERGLTLIPLNLYFADNGYVKVTLGLAKGKKTHDKRHDLAKKDADREIQRTLRERY